MEINSDITNVLSEVAKKQNWKNFDVGTNFRNEKGNGFLGEFFMGCVKNKDTGETINLAIKKAFKNETRRKDLNMRKAYLNEIHFYSNVVPSMKKFVAEKGQEGMLDMIGKYYLCVKDELNETIVMDNLKEQGYDILGREALIDDEHMKLIFKTYGKLHAISFAFKDEKSDEYAKIVKEINDIAVENIDAFLACLSGVLSECFNLLDETLKNRCKHIFENVTEVYKKLAKYEGNSYCIIHGDCWSNNMMFKYKDDVLEGIKLIDFQIIRQGTPVFDLSYMFYGGGSKQLYKNLDKYLHIYYDSFAETVGLLGNDANHLMSFENLKKDWQKYSTFGFLVGLFITKAKLTSSEDVQILTNEDNDDVKHIEKIKVDNNILKERVQDLIEHMCENNFF